MSQNPLGKAVKKILTSPRHVYGMSFYKRLNEKRLRQNLIRAGATLDTGKLDRTYRGVIREVNIREQIHRDYRSQYGRKPSDKILADLERQRRKLTKLYENLKQAQQGIHQTKNRLFNGCTPEEMEAKMQAILNVPLEKFRNFDSLEPEEQERRLMNLMEEYGSVSGNSYTGNMLLIPDFLSPYILNDEKEQDGSKRRPQFVHEMIDRILYAALYPAQFKALFFRPTKIINKETKERKVCKRWHDTHRQIRAEGRLGMVKVLIVLLYRIDFAASLRSGIRHRDGSFSGVPISDIMEQTGLSRSSVNTAIKTLVDLDLLHSSDGKQPYERYKDADGNTCYKGLPVVRCFKLNLIHRLGLAKRWLTERVKKKAGKTPELQNLLKELDELHNETDSSAYIRISSTIEAKMALLAAGA